MGTAAEIAASLTASEKLCVKLLAGAEAYDVSHDDDIVAQFVEDRRDPDTFNRCHDLGLLRSTHNSDTGDSWVVGTVLGREAANVLQKEQV